MNDYGFKWKIGDVVAHLASSVALNIGDREGNVRRAITPLLIVGRVMDDCPGGTQRHYCVRAMFAGKYSDSPPSFGVDILKVHEMELMPLPPEDVE